MLCPDRNYLARSVLLEDLSALDLQRTLIGHFATCREQRL